MKSQNAEEPEIGGGLTGVGRFFTDPCGCGSSASYGLCCAAPEGDAFLDFCAALNLEREVALEIGQLAWRIARDTPSSGWPQRVREVADELFDDDADGREKLVLLVDALLDAHRMMFPGVHGDCPGVN